MRLTSFGRCAVFTALLVTTGLTGRAAAGAGQTAAPDGLPKSIAGSYVYHNLAISPNDCFTDGSPQSFCFQAVSHTTDHDYVYYLWLRFPGDWVVSDVAVYGEPYCTSGGTFSAMSWYAFAANEVRITHVRYHATTDACSAYYCVQATPGSPSPGTSYARVSWYWQSSAYGSPPFYPCSVDGYTPSGQPACDEMVTAPAYINLCLPLFADGFETGTTSAWTAATP